MAAEFITPAKPGINNKIMKTQKEVKSKIKLENGNCLFFNDELEKWVANNYGFVHVTKLFKTKKAALKYISD